MKQIVDFEQAKRLTQLGIIRDIKRVKQDDNYHHISSKDGTTYYTPTIGELIEWIEINKKTLPPPQDWNETLHIDFNDKKYVYTTTNDGRVRQASKDPELIDALVELAINIKEN